LDVQTKEKSNIDSNHGGIHPSTTASRQSATTESSTTTTTKFVRRLLNYRFIATIELHPGLAL
jgi:hypothetical protein